MIQPERVLNPDIRAQLSARLSSRLTCSPSERVDNAFQAGVESKTAILAGHAVVGPSSTGLQNSFWLGIRSQSRLWFVTKRCTADRLVRAEPGTTLAAKDWRLQCGKSASLRRTSTAHAMTTTDLWHVFELVITRRAAWC